MFDLGLVLVSMLSLSPPSVLGWSHDFAFRSHDSTLYMAMSRLFGRKCGNTVGLTKTPPLSTPSL